MSLVEVIKEGEIVRMSERQAREEDLFVLRRVIEEEPQKIDLPKIQKVEGNKTSSSRLQEWKNRSFAYKKNNVVKDLVSNFSWEVSRGRRERNLSRRQLASLIGVSEEEIKMVELGELPRDDFVLISKLENVLGVNLRKNKLPENVNLSDLQKRHEAGSIFDEKPNQSSKSSGSGLSGKDLEIIE